MVDSKRVLYLLVWMLAIGVTIVYLRTLHVQTENQRVRNLSQVRQIRQQIHRNHLDISYAVGSPENLKQMIEDAQIELYPPGEVPEPENQDEQGH